MAFPAIATGIYRFPLDRACAIAVRTVRAELDATRYVGRVIFCMYDARGTETMRATLAAPP